MIFDFSWSTFLALALCVFGAGVVDALAGGGGLITLPAYLIAGLNPSLLLGTNKLASSIGTLTAAQGYSRHLKIKWRALWPAMITCLIGSLTGARLTLFISPDLFKHLLVFILPVVAGMLYWQKTLERHGKILIQRPNFSSRSMAAGFFIGAYDGFLGPGTGTFFAVALNFFCGLHLLEATGRAKILNFIANIAALAAFLWAGRVYVGLGLAMGIASALGNWTGSHLGIKKGGLFIRPALLAVCLGLCVKLIYDISK